MSPPHSSIQVVVQFSSTRAAQPGDGRLTFVDEVVSYGDDRCIVHICHIPKGLPCFFLCRILGQGSFATVKLAVRKSDGTKWAIKVVEKSSLSQEDEAALQSEVKILEVCTFQCRVSDEHMFVRVDRCDLCRMYVHPSHSLRSRMVRLCSVVPFSAALFIAICMKMSVRQLSSNKPQAHVAIDISEDYHILRQAPQLRRDRQQAVKEYIHDSSPL